MITKEKLINIKMAIYPYAHFERYELNEIIDLALKGLAAEKLEKAVEFPDCSCGVKERDSGHMIGCWAPEFNDALAEYRKEIEL